MKHQAGPYGTELRPTYDQLVNDIERDPDKVNLPNRKAMFEWNSQFKLDFNECSAEAHAVEEMAHDAGAGTTPHVPPNHRTDVEPYNGPSDGPEAPPPPGDPGSSNRPSRPKGPGTDPGPGGSGGPGGPPRRPWYQSLPNPFPPTDRLVQMALVELTQTDLEDQEDLEGLQDDLGIKVYPTHSLWTWNP